MNDDTQPPTSLTPPDPEWAARRLQLMDDIESALAQVRMALHHKDDDVVTALGGVKTKIDGMIREIQTRASMMAGPATIIDRLASISPDSVSRFPLPPAVPRSKAETMDAPPKSVGPILDLAALLNAERDRPSRP